MVRSLPNLRRCVVCPLVVIVLLAGLLPAPNHASARASISSSHSSHASSATSVCGVAATATAQTGGASIKVFAPSDTTPVAQWAAHLGGSDADFRIFDPQITPLNPPFDSQQYGRIQNQIVAWSAYEHIETQISSLHPCDVNLSMSPLAGPPGTVVTVTGSGWPYPGDAIDACTWPCGLTIPVDSSGNFTATFTVPADATPGENTLTFDSTHAPAHYAVNFYSFTVTAFSGATGRIAFESKRDTTSEVYVMNTDGNGQTRLTTTPEHGADPAWSPDGTKIAFSSDRSGNAEIYVMNADGTAQADVTNGAADDFSPAWSPDGTRIAFTSTRAGNTEIYVMNADGSGQTQLTNTLADEGVPIWSPDSAKIAFHSNRDGYYEIYVMNADGAGQTRLTYDFSYDQLPAWSPDGSKIAFMAYRQGRQDIYVIHTDGTGETNLSNNPSDNWGAAWSPDGTQMAFVSNRDGNWEIYRMSADGSGQTRLTNNPAEDINPAWSIGASPSAYSISGRVTDRNGQGISGVKIDAIDPSFESTVTDDAGNYIISGLFFGTYTITPSKSGYTFNPSSTVVSFPPDVTGENFVGTPNVNRMKAFLPITILTHAPATVVIFLQGINTELTLADLKRQIDLGHNATSIVGMGEVPKTVTSILPANTEFFQYSYNGSGLETGNPTVYTCQDTFSQPITTDFSLLYQQISRIAATKSSGTETDFYLIGHSLGGAVALGFIDFLEQHLLPALPSGVHLKAVITLDSPIGGVHDFWTESYAVQKIYGKNCDIKNLDLKSPSNLTTVLDSTIPPFHTTPPSNGGPGTLGGQASFLMLSTPLPNTNIAIPSNEFLAEQAQKDLGVSFLTIGNVNDFVWHTQACSPLLTGFVDTQWLEDRGGKSGLYGRSFASDNTCPGLLSPQLVDAVIASHSAVLSNMDVQAGIQSFLKGEPPNTLVPQP